MEDLPELVVIEHLCFSQDEAATREAFEKRIRLIPDTFYVIEENDKILGLINGPVIPTLWISDDLFNDIKENPTTGGHQSILGLAIHPQVQKRGLASKLLTHLEQEARVRLRETITLTCKENLISYYVSHGYLNNGISDSDHAGEIWYNMYKKLN